MTEFGGDLYSVAQIRQIEKRAIELENTTAEHLMISAAKFCLHSLQEKWPDETKLTLYCGTGNNGGDGLYFALLAQEAGYQVEVVMLAPSKTEGEPKHLSAIRLKLRQAGIEPIIFSSSFIPSGKILVDALFGIGLHGALKPEYREVIEHINFYGKQTNAKVLAVDIPSGLDADTGSVTDIAIKADMTVSFIAYKPGLLTGIGPAYCGDIVISKLGLSDAVFQDIQPFCKQITSQTIQAHLPVRGKTAHKNDFGHVVVIGGGELHLAGAGLLSALAALKIGAGLVSLVVPSKSYMRISHAPAELMCYAIDNFNQETAGFLANADVIVIGPGLGQNAWSKQALTYVLMLNKQVVYDADALNLIAKDDLGASMFLTDENKSIFTPHPGEAARLLNTSSDKLQQDRFHACQSLATQYRATAVLKGAGSLIYNQTHQFSMCAVSEPALATAGTGDVLTGIIAGLWAQGLHTHDAASCGVGLHAFLAQGQSKKMGHRGFMASDIIEALSHAESLGVNA